jgi:hypothetical protein
MALLPPDRGSAGHPILAAQLVFHGLEWLVYLPLKLASKAKLGQKQVN